MKREKITRSVWKMSKNTKWKLKNLIHCYITSCVKKSLFYYELKQCVLQQIHSLISCHLDNIKIKDNSWNYTII